MRDAEREHLVRDWQIGGRRVVEIGGILPFGLGLRRWRRRFSGYEWRMEIRSRPHMNLESLLGGESLVVQMSRRRWNERASCGNGSLSWEFL